jgi:hypothetical protein
MTAQRLVRLIAAARSRRGHAGQAAGHDAPADLLVAHGASD